MPRHELAADPAFPHLKRLIIARTGLGYWADKDASLAQRLAALLAAHPGWSLADYHDALAAEGPDGPESDRLYAEMTVGETYFFRSREQFDVLRDVVLPRLIAARAECRRLVIWSAGCSNGAEPYSLAILLRDELAADLSGWSVDILGTDINPTLLRQARTGLYGAWSLRGLPDARRDACFEPREGQWRLRDSYRQGVCFARHNIATDSHPPLTGADLVLCRNLLIYFDPPMRRRVLETQLGAALAAEGWLLLGHAEGVTEADDIFQPVRFPDTTLYRKEPPGKAAPPPLPSPRPRGPPRRRPPPLPPPPAPDHEAEVARLADRGDWSAAAGLAAAWAAAQPLQPLAHYYQGLVQDHLGQDDAQAAYRRAIYLDRGFALAHLHLGRLLQRQGDRMGARRHFAATTSLCRRLPDDHPVMAGGRLTALELRTMAERWLSTAT